MMASLKFIMDVNVDDHHPDRQPAAQNNKKDQGPSNPATTGPQENPPSRPRHSRSPTQVTELDINLPVPPPRTKRRGGALTRTPKSSIISTRTTSTVTRDTENTSTSLSPAANRPSARRTSTTSTDSMDPSQGYGSGASSSSMGGGGGPMRPMPQQPPASDMHVRLTPITGRVSRAKKGVPVHVCDICKPHKTFTRAEHLRRHQLSHGTPQFPCPRCDKAFHRQDLLTRHQQKTDHAGEAASNPGSVQESPHPAPATLSSASSSSSRAARSSGISSHQQAPQQQQQQQHGTPAQPPRPTAASSRSPGEEMSTPPVTGSPYPGGGYELSNSMSPVHTLITPHYHSQQPRAAPPLQVVTQGLPVPGLQLPGFLDTRDASPWTSSASDSSYSTPVSEPNQHLIRGTPALTQQFPGGPRIQGPDIDTMPGPPMYINNYTSNPHQQPMPFSMDNMPPIGYGANNSTGGYHPAIDSLQSDYQRQMSRRHQDAIQMGTTSPPSTGPHINGGLLTSSMPGLQVHADPLRGMGSVKSGTFLDAQTMPGLQVHEDPLRRIAQGMTFQAFGGSGNVSPNGDSGSHSPNMEALHLASLGGCTMPMQGSIPIPLPSPTSDAIPRYLEMYWSRVHPTMPVVHRKSYEAQPEGVLTCAMAAVATQFLDDKEDRTRGNHLHDYAWQEVKRIAKWNLQTKQAILLCEYFARFRGRKAVTSPSKMFRSLYERVSTLQSFAAPPSSSLPDDNSLWLFDPSAWSPTSSHSSSDSSSCGSITPTTTAMSPFVLRHLSALQTNPSWSSFPSSYPSSTTSSFDNSSSSSSSSSSFIFDFYLQNHNRNVSSSPPDARSRAQRSWSFLFAPVRYNPAPAAVPSLSFQQFSENMGQVYSQCFSTQQGLYDDDLDHAVINSREHGNDSIEIQWRAWIQAESSRRLLTACFLCDGHTSIYQQMPRAQDYDSDASSILPCIPIFGATQKLWEASSAEEWFNIFTSNPEAAETRCIPELDQLTAESIKSHTPVDQMVILSRCALQLPRRPNSRTTSVSENNTPAPDFGHHSQHLSAQVAQFNTSQQPQFQNGFPVLTQEQRSAEAESRIKTLFGDSPVANTYLALHHTPLRDLLAVSGDSWLYSQKVLPENLFQDHQKRLRQWVMNRLASYDPVKATMYASRAITLFLARQPRSQGSGGTQSAPWSTDLSDYWALYVCALICWAFGFLHGQPRQRSSSGESSPASKAGNGVSTDNTDEEVLNWLRLVADKNTSPAEVARFRRHEATGVVGLIRRTLASSVGPRNRLYVDAIGVLERLEQEREGQNRKLF
ncbi:hypothetical protein QBC38DRAFT_109534 [Podospora fimiseda]|uniref:C2H2-type domain-containing protein n=1 Tax=Podospora fimiseda TaxID=252190 RepID=A0AAN7H6B0_9PEZI|nr:hypothetical protein QBC38DRAFT_109534 [Podospora fimiseda]